MLKKLIPFIIAVPALFLLFIFKIIPAFYTLLISFKDYKVLNGIYGSPWVGMDNYGALFQSATFRKLIDNTLIISTFSLILTAFLALVLIICICKMPNKWCKICAIAILSVPAFIPVASCIGVLMKAFSIDSGFINGLITSTGKEPILFFASKALYPLLFAIIDSLRNIFVPVIIGVLVCESKSKISFKSIAAVLLGYIAARATVLMSPDIELLHITNNPLVLETADVFDTYSFRSGLMSMQFASSSAVWVVKTIIQLLINITVYFVLSLLAPKISEAVKGISNKVNKSLDSIVAIIGYLLLASGSIAVIILIFLPVSGNIFQGMKLLMTNKSFIDSISVSLMYCIIGSIVYGFITIALSYPLTVRTKFYPILLVIVISIINNFTGEYLLFKSMTNTVIPVILYPGLSVAGAFALYFSISGRFRDGIPGIGQYLKEAILPLVTIVVLYFIANWGAYIYQLVFLSNTRMHGIGLLGMQLLTARETSNAAVTSITSDMIENVIAAFFLISSVIPALLGTVLIFLSKYLPLSAFVSQLRKI